jgi:hypothetical protein
VQQIVCGGSKQFKTRFATQPRLKVFFSEQDWHPIVYLSDKFVGLGDNHGNFNVSSLKPARALSELRLRSLSIRRSAAATRSRARSKSATVYCGGSRRVRFFLGPFVTLLVRTAALSRVPVAIVPFRLFQRIG